MLKRIFSVTAFFIIMSAFTVEAARVRNPITRDDISLANAAFASDTLPGIPDNGWMLVISISRQRMVVCEGSTLRAVYTISSAKAGVGSKEGSERTPLGWHKVTEWIGEDAPLGQVFEARQPTDEVIPPQKWNSAQSSDKVLTRIMWLSGLEPGKNRGGDVDSHARYIYLHGTNQEHLLGVPSSHGCIRMYNHDVVELFTRTKDRPVYCLIMR